MSTRIHPTAIVDPVAELAPDVTVGPFSIIEGPVRVGPGCKIGPNCHLIGPLTVGTNNDIGIGVVLGERPQHLAADGVGADVVIGEGNGFREYVTVHRGSGPGKITLIGDGNYFMANAHVGHDCTVGNRCIFANSALLGGHAVIGDGVFLSGNAAVHQRMRIGRLAFISGCAAASMDVPPFIIVQNVNHICGINVIGMKRAGLTAPQINGARKAYRLLYMQRNLISVALEIMQRELGTIDTVNEMIDFIRNSPRGISTACGRRERQAA